MGNHACDDVILLYYKDSNFCWDETTKVWVEIVEVTHYTGNQIRCT